jgi:hydrogenase maturation protease
MKILVIGYGNPIRGDDGIGLYIAGKFLDREEEGIHVWLLHQLHLEGIEEMLEYDLVMLADCRMEEPGMVLARLADEENDARASSHHLTPQAMLKLGRSLYNRNTELYICSVKGEAFDFCENLTDTARRRADEAVAKIDERIREKRGEHRRG